MRLDTSTWSLVAVVLGIHGCRSSDADIGRTDVLSAAPSSDLVEVFRLGGAEPPEPEMFDRAPLLLVDSTERLYVLHRSEGDVAVFAPDGAFLHWIRGGRGNGPGEFTSPIRMGFTGDTLWIRNLSPPRIVQFDRSGAHLRTESVATPAPYPTMVGAQGVSGYLNGDRAWLEPDGPAAALTEGEHPIAVLELGGRDMVGHRDTVLSWRSNRGRMSGLSFDPIPEPPFYGIAPDGSGVVVIEWNDESPADLNLRVVNPDGRYRWSEVLTVAPEPIPQSERDSIVDEARRQVRRLRESLLAQGVPPGGAPEVPSVAEANAKLYLPASRPPVRRVRLGIDGTIWLELSKRTDGPTWLMIDRASGRLRSVTLPASAMLGQGTRSGVWYFEMDDQDLPWIVRARFDDSQ